MSGDANWLSQGFEGIEDEEARLAASRGPRRFYLKKGKKAQLIWVDDNPACIHEYNPKINGTWTNWFTAPKSDPNYQDLEAAMEIINKNLGNKYRDYYVGYFTVVDCTEWEDNRGNKHRFELKLFPAKIKSLKLLQERKETFGGLAGKAIMVTRSKDDKSPSCGDVFDLQKEVDTTKLWDHVMYQGKLLKEHLSEATENDKKRAWLTDILAFQRGQGGVLVPKVPTFNYMSLLRPKTPKELREMFAGSIVEESDFDNSGSSKAGTGDGAADVEVPF